VSFSRAAWGSLAIGAIAVFFLVFFLEARVVERFRMLVLSITGVIVIVVAIAGLLSIPSVQELFDIRATDQAYDEGESGRFGRQGYAFDIALSHPWGIGPLEFGKGSRVREEPHNSYVNTIHAYGWGGGFFFTTMVLMTVWRSVRFLFRRSPNRLLLIPLTASFIPLAVETAINDVDHWRHFYLLAGLIWGVTAAYDKAPSEAPKRRAVV
jgi:O-antigen ligase